MKSIKYTLLYHTMTVLLEYIDCLLQFSTNAILQLIFILQFPIMLALCLMLSMTHYAQNYADIIGGCLFITKVI